MHTPSYMDTHIHTPSYIDTHIHTPSYLPHVVFLPQQVVDVDFECCGQRVLHRHSLCELRVCDGYCIDQSLHTHTYVCTHTHIYTISHTQTL
jgi:hypothetical protein